MSPYQFLPAPRQLNWLPGTHTLADQRLILLTGAPAQDLMTAGQRFASTLGTRLGFHWELAASSAVPQPLHGLVLRLAPDEVTAAQGYMLSITPEQLSITSHDPAGAFYGVCTLIQLVEQAGAELPCLQIADWPDYPARGVMLDISRDKVPTLATVCQLIDQLAGWKINQFQLYTEHTFAYRQHPEVWAPASPFTGQDILELDAYCRARFVELVPNQNSFGHMHRWLTHPRYAPLAEISGDFDTPWGTMTGPFSLTPVDPGSLELVSSLYDELLPHFSSRLVNVGCDETFDLGAGRSKDLVAQQGPGRVYLDFLLKIYQNLQVRGCKMLFWGDIILQHPELIPELPRDLIALSWGYEGDHPFDAQGAAFAASGIPFYVCPGTSAWNSLAGRTANALQNLLNAAENGLKHGAIGYLNTDWGDSGHWQVLPISYLGYAAGAAYSWALAANRHLDLPTALDRFAFRDPSSVLGNLAYDLGNVYLHFQAELHNASILFGILQRSLAEISAHPGLGSADFAGALALIDEIMAPAAAARPDRPDGALLLREFNLAAHMLRHACQRGQLAQALAAGESSPATGVLRAILDSDLRALITEYRAVWLVRNRPGGLSDSAGRFEQVRRDYQAPR